MVAGLQGVSPWRPATFTLCGFTRIVRLFRVPVSGTLGRILRSDTPPSDEVTEREQGGESVSCMRALAALCSGGLGRDMSPPRWREWAGHESMRVKESVDAEADDV